MTGALTGSDASDHSDPVLSVGVGKLVQWTGIALVVYGVSILVGLVVARGIEAALGWLS